MSNDQSEAGKRRALILAGGGFKVAFQAGVLQVWLDEAGLKFDLADGASGGTFNLAMYAQGMSGKQIADNWRNLDPKTGVDFNFSAYLRLFHAESLFEMGNFRKHVFPGWGLDFGKLRQSQVEATFNVFNFSRQRLEIITPDRMSEDYLAACGALPMWFPPVKINGDLYIDAVYRTDANLEEAIRRGADELWIIWTVNDSGQWRGGFVNQYFQIIEAAANGDLRRVLKNIEENNAAIARGETGCYGRRIEVKMLKSEVALHYLINFSQDRIAEAVNSGVLAARKWCDEQGISYTPLPEEVPTKIHKAQTNLRFTEDMKGYLQPGESEFAKGFEQGKRSKGFFLQHLTIHVQGVNRFITDPLHEARAEGWIESDLYGGKRPVEKGFFNMFVDQADPQKKRMRYRLFFRDDSGQPLTLSGFKVVEDDPGLDLWSDTTTLYTRIYRGHVLLDQEEGAEIEAAGILKLHLTDFLKQLTTFRAEGPTLADRSAALARFGTAFLGKLWDVYVREVVSF